MSGYPIRVTALALLCAIPVNACAQNDPLKPVHYKRDAKDRVISLDYWGTSGLQRAVPRDVSQLERVYISYGTKLTADDVSVLSTLENVNDLMLGGVSSAMEPVTIEGSLEKLAGLKRLRTLWLCKERFRDEDLEFIAKLPELESMDLFADNDDEQKSVITDRSAEFFRRAKTIRWLSIFGGEKLTDDFVNIISQDLPRLESLDLTLSGELTDISLEMLASRCTRLKKLRLGSKRFTDRGMRHLTAASQLEQLWLSAGSLTEACADSIQQLKSLRYLELPLATIDDRALRQLASLPKLEILALRGPALTDEQFALLGNHPALESAFLNGSKLSEAKVIEVVKSIPKLRHLTVGPDKSPLQLAVNHELLGR